LRAFHRRGEGARAIGLLKPEDLLLPRRREILEIIRDHKIITLDFLKRRFQNVTDRTLRYDLKQLEKEGLIKKLGITRGAHYAEAI